jgi:hypothetical protein
VSVYEPVLCTQCGYRQEQIEKYKGNGEERGSVSAAETEAFIKGVDMQTRCA